MWILQSIKGEWLGKEEKDPTFSYVPFSGPGAELCTYSHIMFPPSFLLERQCNLMKTN